MSITETVSAFNSLLRTLIAGVVVGGIGYAGGWAYTHLAPDARLRKKEQQLQQTLSELDQTRQQLASQRIAMGELEAHLQQSQAQIDRMDLSMRLLKVDQRVAQLVVTKQWENATTGKRMTEFVFQEQGTDGRPLENGRSFQIEGDLVYVDYWVIKFDDRFVEAADLDRSTSLCLFRRVFGEFQEPVDGPMLDDVGSRPAVYGNSRERMSDFERQVWDNFWVIANDTRQAASLGIRAVHGEAVSMRLMSGMRYQVTLRASDGLSIHPLGTAVSAALP